MGGERIGRVAFLAQRELPPALAFHFDARGNRRNRRGRNFHAAESPPMPRADDQPPGPPRLASAPESRAGAGDGRTSSSAPRVRPGGMVATPPSSPQPATARGSGRDAARKSRRPMACASPGATRFRSRAPATWLLNRFSSAATGPMSGGKSNSAGQSPRQKAQPRQRSAGQPLARPASDEAPFAERRHIGMIRPRPPARAFQGLDDAPVALPREHRRSGLHHDQAAAARCAVSAAGRTPSCTACPANSCSGRGNPPRRSRTCRRSSPAMGRRRH